MLAILLAVGSAASYGLADFCGGLATRGAHVLRVVAISAPASLLIELALLPLLGGHWSPAAAGWGAAAGAASAAAFVLLYLSLAAGPMSILSPITALVSAALPVLVGLQQGGHLQPSGWVGVLLAAGSIALISAPTTAATARLTGLAFLLAVAAGTAIATQLIFLHETPHNSGVVPLIVGRTVSGAVVLTAYQTRRSQLPPGRPRVALAAAAGAVDALANLAFLLATRHGQLATVAVITALYPAGTVVLARTLLAEHLTPAQWAGLLTAAAAVTLLALS